MEIDMSTLEGKQLLRMFTNIRQKCYCPTDTSYPSFGGRGIKLCPEWYGNFHQFAADLPPRPSFRHTLTLKNSSKDFSPDNVKWVNISQTKVGSRGQRGDLTDEDIDEILRLVHEEKVKIANILLGYPVSESHLRDILLGRARRIQDYPYPAKLYETRTSAQIAKEEAMTTGLWALARDLGVNMSEVSLMARALVKRRAPGGDNV